MATGSAHFRDKKWAKQCRKYIYIFKAKKKRNKSKNNR